MQECHRIRVLFLSIAGFLLFSMGLCWCLFWFVPRASSGSVAGRGEVLREVRSLLERVRSEKAEASGYEESSLPNWSDADPGCPLLVQDMNDEPVEYLVPVNDRLGRTVSVVGVDAVTGKWAWFSSKYPCEEFPLVSAGEASAVFGKYLRKSNWGARISRIRAIVGQDKLIYWKADVEEGRNFKRLYLPAFVRGKPVTEKDPGSPEAEVRGMKSGELPAVRSTTGARVCPVLESGKSYAFSSSSRRDSHTTGLPADGGNDVCISEGRGGAPGSYEIKEVPFHYQATNYWCGPASLEMIFDYWGKDIPQSEIASVANALYPGGVYNSDLLRAAHFSGASSSIQDPTLTGYSSRKIGYGACARRWSYGSDYEKRYSDLKNLISNGYPLLVLTYYDSSHSSGHFRVVKGYNDSLGTLTVHDPWYAPPYSGPNVHFNQSFFVDDLWTYSGRWGMIAAPWKVTVSGPARVSAGEMFTVSARVTYRGPEPLKGDYYVSSPRATITVPSSDYAIVSGSATKPISGIATSGSEGTVSWTLRAIKSRNTDNISVSAKGLVSSSSHSYSTYSDQIGGTGGVTPTSYFTLYLAEGSTDWGFQTYISIVNPNPEKVRARITYQTRSGPVAGPTIEMPALSQVTVNPAETLGSTDFSTKIECLDGRRIAADRTIIWNSGAGEEGHCAVAVSSPARTWYLPEGSSAWGFECWLLIQNPNSETASCSITYMIEGEGPVTVTRTVPGNSRRTFNMGDDIGQKDASIKVESSVPIIPERAMYRNRRRAGHGSIGTTQAARKYYLAEGATGYNVGYVTYVLIQNPQDTPNRVSLIFMTGSGKVEGPSFTLGPNSRKTVRVNDYLPPNTDVSTTVVGEKPIIAERAMYWNNGTGEACHDSIGMAFPHSTFYLPDGETSRGRETWTLVQNPNSSDVTVEVSYYTPTGEGNVVKRENIPENFRKSFNMIAHSGIRGRASVKVKCLTPGKKIMVERAMYWSNREAGTNTIGGYSD